jgi:dihydrofolate reductase
MKKIVYYVASSIDGFISGPNDDVSGYVSQGTGVEQYLSDLAGFDTVIMGRNTYEFGYAYGMKPGQPSPVYVSMEHYIFSDSLRFENPHPKIHVKPVELEEVEKIKEQSTTDIYLCGGGQLAGWLLDNHKIDILKIKLNPLILGQGVRLFGDSKQNYKTELLDTQVYEGGLQIITYKIVY